MEVAMGSKDFRASPFTGNTFEVGKTYAELGRALPVAKSVSPESAGWLRGDDVESEGQGARLVHPFAQSAWVYTAISILARNVALIPFRISRVAGGKAKKIRNLMTSQDGCHRSWAKRKLGETILDSGEVVDLFNNPHPSMDRQLFWEMLVTWFAMRGEFFILPLDSSDQPVDMATSSPTVQRLITLDPGLFWHNVVGYSLEGWRYTGSPLLTPIPSEFLLPSEVIHSRSPNPYQYWRGMSPLVVASLAAQTDYAGEQFQKGLWTNNADTGVIITTEQQVPADQRVAMQAALRERKRKAGTADRPLFLWGGAKLEKPTLTMMDMQFLETRKFLRQEIYAIFSVPESIAGFTSDLNDGGAGGSLDATKISFVESTLGSLCCRCESAVAPVVKSFGPDLIGWFDLDSLPIMQAARRARLDTGVKAFGIGWTRNEVNSVYDLGFPEDPTGNKRYLPFNLQEVGATEPQPSEDDPEKDDSKKSNPFTRMASLLENLGRVKVSQRKPDLHVLWNSHIATRRKQVNLFKGKVGKVLLEYRKKVLAKLDEVHLEKSAAGKSVITGETRSLVDLIFSANEFGKKLFDELKNPITGTLQLAGDELNKEVGIDDPWEMPPKKAKEFLDKREQPVQDCGRTVRNQLNTSLQEGLDGGETTKELSDRVRGVFNDLTDGEARRIAQTEVNLAYNYARQDAMDDAGIEFKAWLSSHGPNVREAHAEAEQDYIDDPIPLNEPFVVGGEQMMFPGDDSFGASAGNIINCQCIQLAAQKTGEDEKSITFKIVGLGEIKFKKKL